MAEASLAVPAQQLPALTRKQCRFFCDLARHIARISIDPSKDDFLHLRLSRRLRALKISSFSEYEGLLRSPEGKAERSLFVEALTTHTTSFFRESHQFDWLRDKGIDMLSAEGAGIERPLVVWSAACSTGAELWSAGMVLADNAARNGGIRRFELMGTDISRAILKKASGATYAEDESAGLPPAYRSRFMMRSRKPLPALRAHVYRIVPELRKLARFAQCNLTDSATLPQTTVDLALLRNVLIYFEPDMQKTAIDGVVSRLRTGGVLMTGHAEAIPSHPNLRSVGPSIYVKE